ncbi:carotenoid oxygenase family protein [Prochlorococcus sp. MIT 1341]|uniref:carotenoid oxygenase family protein n=1 Tax=Prochlorococcus sp. MIT 1341 TaxID=3096221 RepID=UPI002A757EF1|nr:carotenoid oxygenase family protein [Prochlorococcus sp. MIT 1341]
MQTKLEHSQQDSSESFAREDWASAYQNVEKELTEEILQVEEGSLPEELCGTLYRNGPGQMERGGEWIHHPFDGDGMISSINFRNGVATLTNRFVRTEAWGEEVSADKFLYRGVFGTQKPGGFFANAFDLRLKNIANTNVILLGDQLLALWEAAGPYALDPKTLKTKGLSTLGGVLKENEAFSAHPKIDPGHHYNQKRLVTFGVKTGPKSKIRLMEFANESEQSFHLIDDRIDNFDGFAFLHDFAITPNWAIFLQNSISINPIPFLFGLKSAAQCLSSIPNGQSRFLFIPRDSGLFKGQTPRIFNAPSGFVFHHLNAWEDESKVAIESIYYDDFPSIGPGEDFREINFDLLPEGRLKRCEVDLASGRIRTSLLSKQCCEFAMVNPNFLGKKARFAWMATSECEEGNGPLQSIKKLDLIDGSSSKWSAAPRGFVGEPIMLSKTDSNNEDEGWIMVMVWNGARKATDLVILKSINLNLQAIINLPLAIPHGLHGCWVNS